MNEDKSNEMKSIDEKKKKIMNFLLFIMRSMCKN